MRAGRAVPILRGVPDQTSRLQAVVFDFDGVIVDTEELHYEALNRVLAPLGLGFSWERYVESYIGFDDRGAITARFRDGRQLLPAAELKSLVERKAATFSHMVSAEQPEPFPGVLALIRACAGKVPLALCSGALRSDIEPVFRSLNLEDTFDVLVTADDVHASKPDPLCYRLAVERLSEVYGRELLPSFSLAIEDTPVGIRAAKSAHLKVLAITNSYDRDYLSLADHVRDSLEGLDLDGLRRWFD